MLSVPSTELYHIASALCTGCSWEVKIIFPLPVPIPHNSGEGKGGELLRPLAPVDTALGVRVGEVAEAAHHGPVRGLQAVVSGSLAPVQVTLGRRETLLVIKLVGSFYIFSNVFIHQWEQYLSAGRKLWWSGQQKSSCGSNLYNVKQ